MIYCILSNTNALWPHMSSLWMSVSGTLFSSRWWMSLALPRETEWSKLSPPDKTVPDKLPPHLEEQILLHCYYSFLHACVLCMGSHRQTCVCICMESQGTLDVFLDCLPSSALSGSLTLNPNPLFQLVWLASSVFAFLELRIQVGHHTHSAFMWTLVSELQLCSHSEHSPHNQLSSDIVVTNFWGRK